MPEVVLAISAVPHQTALEGEQAVALLKQVAESGVWSDPARDMDRLEQRQVVGFV